MIITNLVYSNTYLINAQSNVYLPFGYDEFRRIIFGVLGVLHFKCTSTKRLREHLCMVDCICSISIREIFYNSSRRFGRPCSFSRSIIAFLRCLSQTSQNSFSMLFSILSGSTTTYSTCRHPNSAPPAASRCS